MQIKWPPKPSKDAVKLTVWALVIAAIGWAIVAWLTRPNDAERYLNQIRVPGFTKVSQYADTDDPGPWARAVFVGPPVEDIRKVVTGPGLTLGRPPVAKHPTNTPLRPPVAKLTTTEWIAYGSAPNNCHVSIDKILDNPDSSWKLTDSQIAQMKDGTADIFKVHVTCGDG